MSRLSVAGFGTRPKIERAEGAADLDQQLVLLELVSWLSQSGRLRPLVELGAGAYHVAVNAAAAAPYLATRQDQWAFAADAGAGLSLQLSRRWALELELHAVLTAPYPVVRFVGKEVARLGRPSFLSTLTLAGWL